MEIRTFRDLVDWTRQRHAHLAKCLRDSAENHRDERASALLDYLAQHEKLLENTITEFEKQADPKVMDTLVYDFTGHKPIVVSPLPETGYANLDYEEIEQDIFRFHEQVMNLYDDLIANIDLAEVNSLLEDLKSLEQHEAMLVARQVGRMDDL